MKQKFVIIGGMNTPEFNGILKAIEDPEHTAVVILNNIDDFKKHRETIINHVNSENMTALTSLDLNTPKVQQFTERPLKNRIPRNKRKGYDKGRNY